MLKLLMARPQRTEAEREARFEAVPAVGAVMALQIALLVASALKRWTTWKFGWWMWLVPLPFEALFVALNTWHRPHRALVEMGIRRQAGIALLAASSVANAFLIVSVIASLISGHETSGTHLLLKGSAVWLTNVVLFGLWFWLFDQGGPDDRLSPKEAKPDFLFPQTDDKEIAPADWRPHFVDYMYVSFTNSIAFSPTDTMPLSRWAKLLMLFESALSALVILLIAARAVNIFRS
jgi:uncharacterized membrane protein